MYHLVLHAGEEGGREGERGSREELRDGRIRTFE